MDFKKKFAPLMGDDSISLMTNPAPTAGRPFSYANGSPHATSSSRLGHGPSAAQDQPLSCVTQSTSKEDCSVNRFIAWAAVKRNSNERMPSAHRRQCPLWQCKEQFQDHEAMLKHLSICKQLANGQYWCYDHNRVERFDDVKCRHCLGHMSKRRKMLSIAKGFFHRLGHSSKRTKKADAFGSDLEDSWIAPPAYDSLSIRQGDGCISELSNSGEVLEIDSVEVNVSHIDPPLPMASAPEVIDPQDLLIPVLPELDSTGFAGQTSMQWQPTPIPIPLFPFSPPEDVDVRDQGPRPSLQVNTTQLPARRPVPRPVPVVPRSKGLSPSSSVRSNASAETTISTASYGSSMISPSSNWSGAWSMASGINTSLTSPVDGVMVDDQFPEVINNDPCPGFLHSFYSELPADYPVTSAPEVNIAVDSFLSWDTTAPVANPSYPADIGADLAFLTDATQLVELDDSKTGEAVVCCSKVKALVGSAWDVLEEQILSSMDKIEPVQDNPLAAQLRAMSAKTIATTGLHTLRVMLNGAIPSSASDMLCFVHLAYALSVVVYEHGAPGKSNELYLQTLSYTNNLTSNDRDLYQTLIHRLWRPPGITDADIRDYFSKGPGSSVSRSSSLKGKAPERTADDGSHMSEVDHLLITARHFLDELECSLILEDTNMPLETHASELYSQHIQGTKPSSSVDQSFLMDITQLLEFITHEFAPSGGQLDQKLNKVYQRVSSGTISTVRRLEVEILDAGKGCMPVMAYLDKFAQRVWEFCDSLYPRYSTTELLPWRNDYHCLGISVVEAIVPEFDNPPGGNYRGGHNDLFELFGNFEMESGDIETTSFLNSTIDTLLCGSSNVSGEPSSSSRLQLPVVAITPPGTETTRTASNSAIGSCHQTPSDSSSTEFTSQKSQPITPAATTAATVTSVDNEQQQQQAKQGDSSTQGTDNNQQQKVEVAHSCCDICGYRPKGDPQWFKGSMAKHKKLQHSTEPPKIYRCPFPGCTSQYKNRPDNLRQHQLEKNHWVEGEEGPPRRPSKRKKVALEEEDE